MTTPRWWFWVALAVSSLAPIPWFWNEQIVIWLLGNEVIAERATDGFLVGLRWVSVGLSILGLLALPRILYWLGAQAYRIERVRVVVDFAWRFLGPVVRPVIWLIAPPVTATVKLGATTASETRHGLNLLWAGTVAGWFGFLILLAEAWRGIVIATVGIGIAAAYLGREISSAYEAIARLAAGAGREISRIGAGVWQVVSDGLAYIGGVIGALARVAQGGVQELLRGLTSAGRYFANGVAWVMQPVFAAIGGGLQLIAVGFAGIAAGFALTAALAARVVADALHGLSAISRWISGWIRDSFRELATQISRGMSALARPLAAAVKIGALLLLAPFLAIGVGSVWLYRQAAVGITAIAHMLAVAGIATAGFIGVFIGLGLDAILRGLRYPWEGLGWLLEITGKVIADAAEGIATVTALAGRGVSALMAAAGRIFRDATAAAAMAARGLRAGVVGIGIIIGVGLALLVLAIWYPVGKLLRLIARVAGLTGRAVADAWSGFAAAIRVVATAISRNIILGLDTILAGLGYPWRALIKTAGLTGRAFADAWSGFAAAVRVVATAISRNIILGLDTLLVGLRYPLRAFVKTAGVVGSSIADAWAMVSWVTLAIARGIAAALTLTAGAFSDAWTGAVGVAVAVATVMATAMLMGTMAILQPLGYPLRGAIAVAGTIANALADGWTVLTAAMRLVVLGLYVVTSYVARIFSDAGVGAQKAGLKVGLELAEGFQAGATAVGGFAGRRVNEAAVGAGATGQWIWSGGILIAQPLGAGFNRASSGVGGRARGVAHDASATVSYAGSYAGIYADRSRPYVARVLIPIGAAIGYGVVTIAVGVATIGTVLAKAPGWILWSWSLKPLLVAFWTGLATLGDIWGAVASPASGGASASAGREFNLTPLRLMAVAFSLAVIASIPAASAWALWPGPGEPVVRVVHWSTGHLTRDGLLPAMAEQFNATNRRDANGIRIVVEVYDAPSELQSKYLIDRIKYNTRLDLNEITNGYVVENIPDPTILTPSSAHWLVTANFELNAEVADIDGAKSIVKPVIGIVTYEEMAVCLGWPQKELGFADIIALRNDPNGWASYPCARAEWGQKPLLAFTDPITSSTGRSLHLSLYSIAAGKDPADLTVKDVNDPRVVEYVKDFQKLIDHYQIGTTVMNTKIYQGKSFGHFFIMPEDNLIHLYEGTERAFINGVKTTAPAIQEKMVMIYPKEGSMPRNNCACMVYADWVTQEQRDAAAVWVDFIRQDEHQRTFMAAGFRPGTDIATNDRASKITAAFGLNPNPPRVVLNPSLTKPEVAAAIDDAWDDVKRPAIVTFVVDTSASMLGGKIRQAKDGMIGVLNAVAGSNQVGFVTFDDEVNDRIDVNLLTGEHKAEITRLVGDMRASGETALYDAIKAGIEMSDAAEGDPDAIRAVVVLTDGQANRCQLTFLDDLIRTTSRSEVSITSFGGCKSQEIDGPREANGRLVPKEHVIGHSLALPTVHPIQIFYIGIGDDADLDVGRMLSEATGAEFQGAGAEDLAEVLEEFSRYF